MKIAVTTPTGQIGRAVTEFLLDAGGDVRVHLLGRRPERLRRYVEQGAHVFVGSVDDADYLVKATQGAAALFWVTPPGYGSDDVRAFQNRLARAAATAIRTNRIPRIVNISSIGGQFASGVGPISGLHDVEEWFNDAGGNVMHLRPGFFFENLIWQIESIKSEGRISLPISGSRRYPMIATRDIARVAADWLCDPEWTGHQVLELHGPAELSFDEVARILSESLGRKIEYVRCRWDEAREHLLENAMSENAADLLIEMYEAVETGKLRTQQPRTAETTTPTTLAEFAREVLLPMLSEPARHP